MTDERQLTRKRDDGSWRCPPGVSIRRRARAGGISYDIVVIPTPGARQISRSVRSDIEVQHWLDALELAPDRTVVLAQMQARPAGRGRTLADEEFFLAGPPQMHQILAALTGGAQSVDDLADTLDIPAQQVVGHLRTLGRIGLVGHRPPARSRR